MSIGVAVGVAVIAAGAWIGFRGLEAKSELEELIPLAEPVRAAAEARDLDRLRQLLVEVQTHSSAAAGLTGDPIWRAVEVLPVIGPNMAAVRVLSSHTADISRSAAPVLSFASEAMGDDSWELIRLADAEDSLTELSDSLAAAASSMDGLERDGLLPEVNRAVDIVDGIVMSGAPMAASLAHASAVLPGMLGADEPRTILVMLQNNAELRTGGGIAGSFALLEADRGSLTLVDQASAADFDDFSPPDVSVPPWSIDLYGSAATTFVQNSTVFPDFSLTAQLVGGWWQARTGSTPDAILSLDLPAIAGLMATSGPIVLPDGTELSADNLVSWLLIDLYFAEDRERQTEIQQEVTARAVDRILSGGADPFAWAESLGRSITEGRVSAWSSDGADQAILLESGLGGPEARLLSAGADAYAVWLNDATAGKMDPFLDVAIDAGQRQCRADGRAEVEIAVTLTNTAPEDADSWPWWVNGGGIEGVAPGDIATDVSVAGVDALLGGVREEGALIPTEETSTESFTMATTRILLSPGEARTVTFRFVAEDPRAVDPVVHSTPLMRSIEVGEAALPCP